MALFCQNMLEIAARAGDANPAYEDVAAKFIEHFLWIASAMMHAGADTGMWDEDDGFFYDVLRLPDGRSGAAEGPLDGRPPPALCGDIFRGRALRKCPAR